jgi:hypothetical protein
MTPLFKKLNYKDQKVIFVQNPPEEFSREMSSMSAFCPVETQLPTKESKIGFILIFVTRSEEIDQSVKQIFPLLEEDSVLWYAYPKASSKKYRCEFNRDTGWNILGEYQLEPVRQVAVDEDWSALRFRKVEFIKNFTRNDAMILSEKGREKRKGKSGL